MRVKLGEVCTVVSGTTPSSSVPEYWDGTINWVTPAELSDDSRIVFESVRKITKLAVQKSGLSSFPAGTVLLSSRAPIGKVAIAGVEMYCNQGFKNLICSERIHNEYLFWFLKGNTEYLNSLGRGATFKEISKSIVEGIEIPLPEIDEQMKIAAILDKVSDLIAMRKKQLQKLDDLVKSQFIEMFGDTRSNPKKWEKGALNTVSEVRGRVGWKGYQKQDLRETGPLVLGATHLTSDGNLDLSSPVYLSREKYEESPEIVLQVNDLIFTQRGNTIGKVGLIDRDIGEATINPCVLILRPLNINPVFFKVYFLLETTHEDMWKLNSGSAQPMITQKGISSYEMILPPLQLQEQFAVFVEQTNKSKSTIQQSLDKLELLKKALMQKYFG